MVTKVGLTAIHCINIHNYQFVNGGEWSLTIGEGLGNDHWLIGNELENDHYLVMVCRMIQSNRGDGLVNDCWLIGEWSSTDWWWIGEWSMTDWWWILTESQWICEWLIGDNWKIALIVAATVERTVDITDYWIIF